MAPSPSRSSQEPPPPVAAETEQPLCRSPAPPVQPDDAQFPQGQCRYILMVADLKGQRCGCVTFSHNKAMPGATCECGHLSCFHMNSADVASPGKNKDDIEILKRRVQSLEQQADMSSEHRGLGNIVHRLSQAEDHIEKNQEETRNEIKGTYKHISAAWQLVEQLQQRLAVFEENQRIQSEQLERAGKELQDLRNRNLELLEAEEMLEERVEKLESTETLPSPAPEPLSRASALDAFSTFIAPSSARRRRSSAHRPDLTFATIISRRLGNLEGGEVSTMKASPPSGSWTVHVSLLPSRELPFPFEKDTNAYKRCLSRGLHRMVAVEGLDARSFVSAVSRAFKDVLGDTPWEPLQVKLCDARKLEGLPMLRTLEPDLSQKEYDARFIQEHCSVCDVNGRTESMYVAASHGSLSWNTIRRLPVYVEGLEASWDYDKLLDGGVENEDAENGGKDPQNQGPGQLTSAHSSPSLKRDASEMQAHGFASGLAVKGEADGHRTKMARTCMSDLFEVRREMEAAL